jgi:hypothetical protein
VWVITRAAPLAAHACATPSSLSPLTSLIICAPAASAARATEPRQVSTDTVIPAAARRFTSDTTRAASSSAGIAWVSVRPDSPPTSTIAAPASICAVAFAASSSSVLGP